MRRINLIIFFTFLVLLLVSPCVNAEDIFLKDVMKTKDSLKGLKYFGVIVLIQGDTKELPFNKNDIITDTELKLRMAGIKVRTDNEPLDITHSPCYGLLQVNLSVLCIKDLPICSITSDVEVVQWITLPRDSSIDCMAFTWKDSHYFLYGTSQLNNVRETIKGQLDKFLNDYLSVNPKEIGQ